MAWHCTCGASNRGPQSACEVCGTARPEGQETAPRPIEAFVPPWKRPGFKPSRPDDRCDEPGCTLTIREHIEAFKQAGEKILKRAVTL